MADTARLVKTFIKIRDKKEDLVRKHKAEIAALEEQQQTIKAALLEHCRANNETGGKTTFGTYSRTTKTRYETADWDAFNQFVIDYKAPQLLEKRIQQGNMEAFLKAHPDLDPPGLRKNRKFDIVIRKPSPRG